MRARQWVALGYLLVAGATAGGCEEFSSMFATEEDDAATSGSDRNAGGGPPAIYQGAYQREVHHLLSRVSGWRTSANAQTDGGVAPNVSMGPGCIRDTYVAAAVAYAWAAESYYRLRHAQATEMANSMRGELNKANQLCSSAPSAGASNCRTTSLWGCPPPV